MAFRDNNKGKPEAKLKDKTLRILLEKFLEEHPRIEKYLCNDKGVHLMRLDGEIAYEVIKEFTKRKLPILCVHDSFIVEHTQDDILRKLMDKMTSKVVGRKLTLESDTLGIGGVQAMNNLDPMDTLSNYKRLEHLREQHLKVDRCKGYSERMHRWTQWMVNNTTTSTT
ncbi:hypothetical protein E3W66_08595 [Gammaproteobacteria bacterium LSUCC0057]|uniref:DNA-directed RNA polymerase n=1 Tax=Gammaproteobacteria bacterium LSUCC0057 TaxID=2559237 RepID=A0A4Y8UFN6_9GAMM|nr:hypothetical protein E3W66_08595 [Gammaproteobacteria bacterium LSUCC0057]